jgi:hypothetical protein
MFAPMHRAGSLTDVRAGRADERFDSACKETAMHVSTPQFAAPIMFALPRHTNLFSGK